MGVREEPEPLYREGKDPARSSSAPSLERVRPTTTKQVRGMPPVNREMPTSREQLLQLSCDFSPSSQRN